MGLMKQVLQNIDLNAVGVTTKKSEFWHVLLFFGTHIFLVTNHKTCSIKVKNHNSTLFCAELQ